MRKGGWRRKGIRWDYNGDGLYCTERLPKFFKRYWRKWRQRQLEILE